MKKILLISTIVLSILSVQANDELSKRATAFYSDNNYTATMDILLQINEKERTAQDWLLLGNLSEEKNEINNALFMYEKSITANKKFYKPYYNIANIYQEEEKYNLAIDYYKRALRYKKDNAYLYYNLGCCYIKIAELGKAKSCFIKALGIKNDIPELHYNLAYIYKKQGKTKLAETYLANYNKLINQ